MICPKCGHEYEERVSFCPECGERLPLTDGTSATAVELPRDDVQQDPMTQGADSAQQTVVSPVEPVQNNQGQAPYSIPQTPNWYQQPQNQSEEPTSVLKWLGLMLLESFVGIVHVILMFVFAFSSKTEKSLKNYARAKLIMTAILVVLSIIAVVLVIVFCAVVGSEVMATDPFYDYDYGYGDYYDDFFEYDDGYDYYQYSNPADQM